ncbi:MAG: NAD-dependent epimerase/dehydratase family protein [Puniceicoccaceae bacterium]|nr:MAG: NAD-dependent epimerase/dehydratase family protein [Puniceicoccaceae bacterium]
MVVLLGGSGYVGQAFRAVLARRGEEAVVFTRATADYTNTDALHAALADLRPDFLINCAGFTGRPNVDACEDHRAECYFANAVLPALVRQVCEELRIPWGHVSSGCIYTGCRSDGSGFTEEDPPNFTFNQNNCSFYSGCKAFGEQALVEARDCYIWRLRIPFNEVDCSRNYLSKLLRYDRLLDARNSITQVDEFADAALACRERRLPPGIYNIVNPGIITAREIVELFHQVGITDKQFSFFSSEAEFHRLAARAPRSNCILSPDKLAGHGIRLTEIHEAVERALRNWVPAPLLT